MKAESGISIAIMAFAAIFIYKFWTNEQKTEQFLTDIGKTIGGGTKTIIDSSAQAGANAWNWASCLINPNGVACNINDPGLQIIPQTTVDYNPGFNQELPAGQTIVGSAPWYKSQAPPPGDPLWTAALAEVGPVKAAGSGYQDDINTGETVGGLEVWTTPSGVTQLQSLDGSFIVGGNAAAGMIAAGNYEDTGLIWDASTGQSHNKSWYIHNQQGLAATWGWI
jgi:hypothetical protein